MYTIIDYLINALINDKLSSCNYQPFQLKTVNDVTNKLKNLYLFIYPYIKEYVYSYNSILTLKALFFFRKKEGKHNFLYTG